MGPGAFVCSGLGYTLGLEVVTVVSSRGGKHGYVKPGRHRAYKALRRKGMSKTKAARIANAGDTHAKRSRMARRAARTRRARGKK